ncbi:MAG: DUF3426 domain-containing protein [Desulfobacterales bacterium]
MILTCEKCDTSFSFDESLIKPTGSKVRCSKCRNVFVVHPPAPAAKVTSGATVQPDATVAAADIAGLDDLDLTAIEKSLDLNLDGEPDAGPSLADGGAPGTSELDFDAADFAAAADIGAIAAADDSDDLNFELDLDSLTDDAETDSRITEGSTETMDFELDLDLDDAGADTGGAEAAVPTTDEIEFDLDFDGLEDAIESADDKHAGQATTGPDAGSDDDLDFGLGLNLGDDAVASELDITAADISGDDEEKSVVSAAVTAFEETQELDLSDVDSLFDLGHDKAGAAGDGDQAEDLDLELDPAADGLTEPLVMAGSEATEELDLAELEEMIENADDTTPAQDSLEEDGDFELDLGLDPAFDSGVKNAGKAEPDDAEITDDFDLTGLDDLLEEDAIEPPPGPAETPAESPVAAMDLTDEPTLAKEDAGVADLDEMLELADEDSEAAGVSAESTEELDLEFGAGRTAAADTGTESADTGDNEDAEFDLSDLDGMLDLAEDPAEAAAAAEDDDFELQLDLEELPAAGAIAGATAAPLPDDLEFEAEEEGDDDAAETETAAMAAAGEADAFGMGALSENDGALETDREASDLETEEAVAALSPVVAKKRSGGLVRAFLALVLLLAVGVGALFAARHYGIEIPYLDKLRALDIPYVSELLGPKVEDAGNLKIAIDEKDVTGRFVTNDKLGTLYVVSGQIKNEYEDPRSAIRITGKIYSKGHKLELEKTVYAGNVLSESDLAGADQTAIDQKLQNRFGQDRKNVNVKKNTTLPFMIVFANLPKDPDEYTVEAAGSQKVK